MRERINKPRVFLSHARKDVTFIERIEADLRKCQIEPWRDQNEIRDGQPWMQAIFEDGIPTCDAILAYFTENSLTSGMVEKEVDSAILRRLDDKKIAFLPYVDDDKTRAKLRVDIQTLQCRVWNKENYYQILPSIVAQIWQSYLERSVDNAISQEKIRRLELELEVKRLGDAQTTNIFSKQEEHEFQYIFDSLDFPLEVYIPIYQPNKENARLHGPIAGKLKVVVSFIYFLLSYTKKGNYKYDNAWLSREIGRYLSEKIKVLEFCQNKIIGSFRIDQNLEINLVRYGLTERDVSKSIVYPFTSKMNRFMFWIEYNEIETKVPIFKFIEITEEKN